MSEKRKPEHLIECDDEMSNFDHTIDDGMEEKLRSGEYFGRHAARNFNGSVWFEDGRFYSEIWRYGSFVKTLSADSLPELMTAANDEYGYE